MIDFLEFFGQAELSLAAYASLSAEISFSDYQDALVEAGFSKKQAEYFSNKYIILDSFSNSNGLSATVFSDAAGNKYLAIRGTNDLNDLLTDIVDIALLGTTRFQSQYASLKPQVEAWIADGTLSDATGTPRFTVTGHKPGRLSGDGDCGGFRRDGQLAYLYNSPGVGGLFGVVTTGSNPALARMNVVEYVETFANEAVV